MWTSPITKKACWVSLNSTAKGCNINLKKSNKDKIETNFNFYKLFQRKEILTKKLRTKLKTKRSKKKRNEDEIEANFDFHKLLKIKKKISTKKP